MTKKDNTIEILKERAALLAEKPHDNRKNLNALEIVEFSLDQERYGIAAHFVQEVYPLKDVTPLPSVPSFVHGLINVRRRIIPVLDLKVLFSLRANERNENNKVIILEGCDKEFGIIADEVLGVHTITLEGLQTQLPGLTGLKKDLLQGMTRDRLILLDGKKILLDSRIIVEAKK